MKTYEATEQAYKNGYEQGKKDALKWIPVSERLPEKHGGIYLCLYTLPGATESFPYCLHWHAYGSNGFVNGPHFSDEGISGMKVTHWMPLPEPPKGE
jgi:hypothetical protein